MRTRFRCLRPVRSAAILALGPLLLVGCGDVGVAGDSGAARSPAEPPAETEETATEIPGELHLGSWVLESFSDGTPAGEGEITLALLPEARVAGSGGCNRFMGPCETDGSGGLSFGVLASTMMACPQEIMDRERHYLALLERVSAFRLDGMTLVLMNAEGEDLLTFRRAEDPEGETAAEEEDEP